MAKKEFSKQSIDTVDLTDIPDDLYYIVAEATLYDQDPITAIASYYKGTAKGAIKIARQIFSIIVKSPKYKEYKEDYDTIQKATLGAVDHDVIMLKVNRMMQWALESERPEIYFKGINKIQEINGITNNKGEIRPIEFRFKPTNAINLAMIKEELAQYNAMLNQTDTEE